MKNMFELPVVNRSVVVVSVKSPFFDWLNQLPSDGNVVQITYSSLEELNREPFVFLAPEIFDDAEWEAYIETRWPIIFDSILGDWTTDQKHWPKKRSEKLFHQWFTVSLHSVVRDLPNRELLGYSEIF